MTGQRLATVGDTIKVRLAPVEGHVKPDWHPEAAGSTQQETGQQSKCPGVKQSDPILSGVAMMRVAKNAAERIAADQKPMPAESVNSPYPRARNSSRRATR